MGNFKGTFIESFTGILIGNFPGNLKDSFIGSLIEILEEVSQEF